MREVGTQSEQRDFLQAKNEMSFQHSQRVATFPKFQTLEKFEIPCESFITKNPFKSFSLPYKLLT